jgi:hypothetical protein
MGKNLLVWLAATALLGCTNKPSLTIAQFHQTFKQMCTQEPVLADLNTQQAEQACVCMTQLAAKRWTSINALTASLMAEDRVPRGELDYYRGAARITYKACKG